MANIPQVISQIRFQIEQLASGNAHHNFEHLCRHLVRTRICSNIIPATGPVSAGGDQGADFESFSTYITGDISSNSAFTAKIKNKSIAFSCSIQRTNIILKIKSDVKKLMESGLAFDEIYYFAGSDIQISHIHDLKKWAKDEYNVKLEIHDAQSISELLADREIFWIAEEFLNIPSEIFPRLDDEEDWYTHSYEKWRMKSTPNLNYSDFLEIKSAVRHLTFDRANKQDIPFWLKLLEFYYNQDSLIDLKRKAIYEIAVAKLRGLGTLAGEEERIREYFSEIPHLENPAELEDAGVLLTYCTTASLQGLILLSPKELDTWHNQIIERVDGLVSITRALGYSCNLLEIRGFLELYINPLAPQRPSEKEIERAIDWWQRLIDLVDGAPLFPLERFADRITDLIFLIGDSPRYGNLSEQLDVLLTKRSGGFIAAQKCKDRAMKFYQNGKKLRAINQLHQSKVKWFADETLRGSILSILLISLWYREIGLNLAAKYYALAAAYISYHSQKPEIKHYLPKAISKAAEIDYLQGLWWSYLDLTELAIWSHELYSNASTSDNDDFIELALYHASIIVALAERLDADVIESVQDRIEKWNCNEFIEELIPIARNTWNKKEIDEIWEVLENDLYGRPFGDIGEIREVRWYELGILWIVSWSNNYETTPLAEQFIAILQIVLADLAEHDLCLMKTEVNILISITDEIEEPCINPRVSNSKRIWDIFLPVKFMEQGYSEQEITINVLSLSISILSEISLLPRDQFEGIITTLFEGGITNKITVGKLYAEIYQFFIPKKIFNQLERGKYPIPYLERNFKVLDNDTLPWFNGTGPGYTKESSEEYLKNRYSRIPPLIHYTLEKLKTFPDFNQTVKQLKAIGWLDWQILNAISVTAINYRVRQFTDSSTPLEIVKLFFDDYMSRPETLDDLEVPLSEFSEEKLRFCHQISMLSTIKILGLECHQATPDFNAIEHFLINRYNYWSDDIEHPEYFSQ